MFLTLEREKFLEIYHDLFLTQIYDEALKGLSEKGLWTFYHGIIGEEAVPVGVCAALRDGDYAVPVHRTQMGVMVSQGVALPRLTAELLGREDGYCGGVSGTHVACMERGVLSKTGILCAGLPVAVGAGLSLKLRGTNGVVAVFIGDGASSAGNFHEALNIAAIWSLPVIFVLENNGYAMTTSSDYALAIQDLSERSKGYGIPGVTVDGNDVLAVYDAAKSAVEQARRGGGPSLIECKTYRIMGHHGHGTDEAIGYRSREEVEDWRGKCPVAAYRRLLLDKGFEEDVMRLEAEASRNVQEAVDFAMASPFPPAENVRSLSKGEVLQ